MYERSRERHALPLSARVRSNMPVDECRQIEPFHRSLYRDGRVGAPQPCRELDVLPRREIGITERVVAKPPQRPSHLSTCPSKGSVIHVAGCGASERSENR